ncbi:MAG: CapA family protein [Clostridia bacterium]|nr:CapA family protein [Clostridia bacterium]
MRGLRGRRKTRINYKKLVISMTLIVLLVALVAFCIGRVTKTNTNTEIEIGENQEKQEEKVIPDDITFNLVAVGDIMCHSTNFKAAYNDKTKEYDFSPVFANIAKYITKADISIRKLRDNFCRRSKRI